jgi:hypothetical protein
MIVLIKKQYEGCNPGDRVTFHEDEGRAVVAGGFGDQVRWQPDAEDPDKGEYVVVVRQSAEVSDVAAVSDV